MSRYIDADALSRCLTDEWGDIVTADEIDNAPSIDIVRCKECKMRKTYRRSDGEFYQWCHENIREVKFDDFCSYGERRTDE